MAALDVDVANKEGLTALMDAAQRGRVAVAKHLVEQLGANIEKQDVLGETAITKARNAGQTDMVNYLTEALAKKKAATSPTPAAERKLPPPIPMNLLSPKAAANVAAQAAAAAAVNSSTNNNINKPSSPVFTNTALNNNKPASPTFTSATLNNKPVSPVFTAAPAPSSPAASTISLSSHAASTATPAAVPNVKLDVDAANKSGITALMDAASRGKLAVVKHLVENLGANIRLTDTNGESALDKAKSGQHSEVVQYLARRMGIKTHNDSLIITSNIHRVSQVSTASSQGKDIADTYTPSLDADTLKMGHYDRARELAMNEADVDKLLKEHVLKYYKPGDYYNVSGLMKPLRMGWMYRGISAELLGATMHSFAKRFVCNKLVQADIQGRRTRSRSIWWEEKEARDREMKLKRWIAHEDPVTKKTYFENTRTGEVTWIVPPEFAGTAPVWVSHVDAVTGNPYYHNTVTGEVTWEIPDDGPLVADENDHVDSEAKQKTDSDSDSMYGDDTKETPRRAKRKVPATVREEPEDDAPPPPAPEGPGSARGPAKKLSLFPPASAFDDEPPPPPPPPDDDEEGPSVPDPESLSVAERAKLIARAVMLSGGERQGRGGSSGGAKRSIRGMTMGGGVIPPPPQLPNTEEGLAAMVDRKHFAQKSTIPNATDLALALGIEENKYSKRLRELEQQWPQSPDASDDEEIDAKYPIPLKPEGDDDAIEMLSFADVMESARLVQTMRTFITKSRPKDSKAYLADVEFLEEARRWKEKSYGSEKGNKNTQLVLSKVDIKTPLAIKLYTRFMDNTRQQPDVELPDIIRNRVQARLNMPITRKGGADDVPPPPAPADHGEEQEESSSDEEADDDALGPPPPPPAELDDDEGDRLDPEEIARLKREGVSLDTFSDAVDYVYGRLERDIYSSFVQSPEYKKIDGDLRYEQEAIKAAKHDEWEALKRNAELKRYRMKEERKAIRQKEHEKRESKRKTILEEKTKLEEARDKAENERLELLRQQRAAEEAEARLKQMNDIRAKQKDILSKMRAEAEKEHEIRMLHLDSSSEEDEENIMSMLDLSADKEKPTKKKKVSGIIGMGGESNIVKGVQAAINRVMDKDKDSDDDNDEEGEEEEDPEEADTDESEYEASDEEQEPGAAVTPGDANASPTAAGTATPATATHVSRLSGSTPAGAIGGAIRAKLEAQLSAGNVPNAAGGAVAKPSKEKKEKKPKFDEEPEDDSADPNNEDADFAEVTDVVADGKYKYTRMKGLHGMPKPPGWFNAKKWKSVVLNLGQFRGSTGPEKHKLYCHVGVDTCVYRTTTETGGIINERMEFELNNTTQWVEVSIFRAVDNQIIGYVMVPVVELARRKTKSEMVWMTLIPPPMADMMKIKSMNVELQMSCHLSKRKARDCGYKPIISKELTPETGLFADKVRGLVSKKKMRWRMHGFDLDLSYITPTIIAMGYPSSGGEGVYRNPLLAVQKFFMRRHPQAYKLYNLCSERQYPPQKFEYSVACYPFDDHNPPPFEDIKVFCEDVRQWLSDHPQNTSAIHCKAGKGRTGGFIAPGPTTLFLNTITLTHIPKGAQPQQLFFTIMQFAATKIRSRQSYNSWQDILPHSDGERVHFDLTGKIFALHEDVLFVFCKKTNTGKMKLFQFWLNTRFMQLALTQGVAEEQKILGAPLVYRDQKLTLVLPKKDLDKATKDCKKHKKFDAEFRVEMIFAASPIAKEIKMTELNQQLLLADKVLEQRNKQASAKKNVI